MGVEFLYGYELVSDQVTKNEVAVIMGQLKKALASGVAGDVVELGCYVGTTSLFLQRALIGSGKQLHVYDSFEGLPAKTSADESPLGKQYQAGSLSASKPELVRNFKRAGLPLPVIHKGWFDQLKPEDLPTSICFAYLDGDLHSSIQQSLKLVWPKLSNGAVVVVDDYSHQGLPGARKAVDDWLKAHPCKITIKDSLAILEPT